MVNFVLDLRPGLRVLLWDDMLRKVPADVLRLSAGTFLARVEPVVWNYCDTLAFPEDMWAKYGRAFAAHGVWAATAFKGASSPHAKLPRMAQASRTERERRRIGMFVVVLSIRIEQICS